MNRSWGYLSALTVALLFGIWFSLDKTLLGYLHPFALAALTYLIASVFLFFINFSPLKNRILDVINQDDQLENFMSRKDYGLIFITAVFGSLTAPALYLSGLSRITAVNAALLTNVEILFIIVIGIFFLKEEVHKKDILGFAFLLLGAIFLSTNNLQNITFNQSLFGSLLVVSASFFWSLDTSLSKFLSRKQNIIFVTALKSGIGGSILFLMSLILGLNFTLPVVRVPLLLFIGLICVSFSLVLIYYSLRNIGSTRTGSIFALSSLFGAVTAFIVLNEPLTPLQLSFGVLMLVGVFVLYKEQK
jgi:drug/metabolite transporter (DMT)-like permease